MKPGRLPLEPLEVLVRNRVGADITAPYQIEGSWTRKRFARILNADPAQVWRWEQSGLRPVEADRLSCEQGFHPSEVWPDWSGVNVDGLRFDVSCPQCGCSVWWWRPLQPQEQERRTSREAFVSCFECDTDFRVRVVMSDCHSAADDPDNRMEVA